MKKWLSFATFILFIIGSSLFVFGWLHYPFYVALNKESPNFQDSANRNESFLYIIKNYKDRAFKKNPIIPFSNKKIDVVIPLVEKDLETVVYTIQSIRQLVMHPLGNIYIVSPPSNKIIHFARQNQCIYVDERSLPPFQEVKKHGGWMIQQFLKLSMDSIVKEEHYLVIDADTIFLRPQVFDDRGKYIANVHWDFCQKRKLFTQELLGNNSIWKLDFVTHHMLFSKKILKNMKDHITRKHHKEWATAISDLVEKDKDRGFSEYDIYATYLTEFSQEPFTFVSNANITIHRDLLPRLPALLQAYAAEYKTVSLHHFIFSPMHQPT